MFDSLEELLRKIRLGEDALLELKAVRFRGDDVSGPRRDELADEIVAFANMGGGVVVLGVDDKTREIEGIPVDRLDSVERFVREVVNDSITPPVSALIVRTELPSTTGEARAVLKIDIPRSLFVHKGPGGYFQRIGSSKRELKPDFLARLFQERSQARVIRFDEQVVPGTTAADLDLDRARSYFPPGDPDEIAIQKLLLVRGDGGILRCTVGGLLLFGRAPQQYLPNARIEAVRYRGVKADTNYQIDARSCEGPLEDQVTAATTFVEANMRVGALKTPARVDLPQFDIRVVFEAIVNAVVHRDYSIHGSKIRAFLFDDRMELYSPGALPNSVTIETMAARQATRNELIVRFLSKARVQRGDIPGRVHFVEARGEGVPFILEEGRRLSGRPPVYELFDDELRLTIYGRPFDVMQAEVV